MNTASQDLAHHLGVLQQKLEHPTNYEHALSYFLEEFAGDAKFMQQCEVDEAPHLKTVLTHVAGKALGQKPQFEQFRAFRLPEVGFAHGSAAVVPRVLLFFYFEKVNTGLMALLPGIRGEAEVARFRLPGGLLNPKDN